MSTVNINSHHFGFGALDLDNILVTPEECLHTQRQPSNKFKEKVMLKQRKVEVSSHSFLTFLTNLFSQELMMNNRIKKLQNEENRLKKQIAIAARLCESAGEVSKRRRADVVVKAQVKTHWAGVRAQQASVNIGMREINRENLNASARVV